jgi:hypothetical protein
MIAVAARKDGSKSANKWSEMEPPRQTRYRHGGSQSTEAV